MLNDSKSVVKYAVYVIVFYIAVKYALPLTAPFILGLSVAAAVQKPAALLSSRISRFSKKTCCIIMTSALIFGATAIIYLALCTAVRGAMSVCPGIPEQLSRLRQFVASASAETQGADSWGKFTAFVASGANWCLDLLTENYRQYLPSVLARSTRLISGLPSFLTAALFALLSALFGCGEFDSIKDAVKQWLPDENVRRVSMIIRVSTDTVGALIKTYGTIMLITFAELTAGLGIMSLAGYGTGNIVTIALLISFIDILPVLGTGTVLIPWGLFEIVSGRTVSGTMLLALFVFIEIVRNLLEPKLISHRLELHPVFTLAGVYVGGKLFGVAGIFAMPLAMMIFRRFRMQKTDEAD